MISVEEFQLRVGIDQQHLESRVEQGWLVPERDPVTTFSEIDVARAELIRDLQQDFGVNDPGVSLILHLLDQLDGVRRSMHELLAHVHARGNRQPRYRARVRGETFQAAVAGELVAGRGMTEGPLLGSLILICASVARSSREEIRFALHNESHIPSSRRA